MMQMRTVLSLGLSALALGGLMAGCSADRGGLAAAGTRESAVSAKLAMKSAGAAWKALARHDGVAAIGFAEAAVRDMPQNADYRMMLGQSYMQGGRFASAHAAFADALTLDRGNGKAALNMALAQVATGDLAGARETLAANSASIAPADQGLALALAGDPVSAVAMLTQAARQTGATPKLRQNLALSLALAGQWGAARAVAAVDMSPADLDRRMEEWAAFAQPQGAADQVASLLGVTPAADPGQPMALALNAPISPISPPVAAPSAVVQTAAATPEAPAPPPAPAPTAPVPVQVAAVAPAPAATLTTQDMATARIVFAGRREVVQPLASFAAVPSMGPARVRSPRVAMASAERIRMQAGDWYIQLGAFDNAAVARDGWSRAVRRMPALAERQPTGMPFRSDDGVFYRLSVGGFEQEQAASLCRRYQAKGGTCFVRRGAGDRLAEWLARSAIQLASR